MPLRRLPRPVGRPRTRFQVERLEARLALSTASASLTSDHVLEILGTGAADRIAIERHGKHVEVRVTTGGGPALVRHFRRSEVASIAVHAGAGDDRVSNRTAIPSTIDGGAGDDSLSGGSGSDLILGGAGDDSIRGNAGDDVLVGGSGSDLIQGGSGSDMIVGGGGSASTPEAAGSDTLGGGSGADTILAASPSSTVNGGAGGDQVFAPAGTPTGSDPSDTVAPTSAVVTAPITPQAQALASFLDRLDVTQNWLPGVAVDWYTGQPTTAFTVGPSDTHCSAFAASVASRLGIHLLGPPDHSPTLANDYGQEFLANAQNYWLNGQYTPDAPGIPSQQDLWISPGVATASQSRWSNVATALPSGASAYGLALKAQDLANQGYLVIASILGNQGYQPGGPPPSGPGHIVVIRPASLTAEQVEQLGPAEAQAGAFNSSDTNILLGFRDHIPAGTTSIDAIVGATTSFTAPRIQFFYASAMPTIPAPPAS